jgi:hypothetical protein
MIKEIQEAKKSKGKRLSVGLYVQSLINKCGSTCPHPPILMYLLNIPMHE